MTRQPWDKNRPSENIPPGYDARLDPKTGEYYLARQDPPMPDPPKPVPEWKS
jgi:hypothetical protein